MRILYFGTVCNRENYMAMLEDFRVKPSIAPFVFETALLEGFRSNQADIDVISFPVIPAYPKSKHLVWGHRKEILESGYPATWISAVNVTGLKQLCQQISSRILLEKWLKDHAAEEKAVIIYSAYQPVSRSIVTMCKKYHTKCYAIIPDLPRDMFNIARIHPLKKVLSSIYVRSAEKVQGCFDGYVYLTEAMKDVINPDAPYTVVEGIANVSEMRKLSLRDKAPGFVIMYAGTLNEKYGIRNLVEAFMGLSRKDAQLWIFGSGDFQVKIEQYAQQDNRIRYFGRVSREQVLEYERQATLLVNVRSDQDEFTKYSFPSKVIEYMLSGTPMFMTKLSGIPTEYYDYTYAVNDNRGQTIREELEKISAEKPEILIEFGARAQQFIMKTKNSSAQAARIMDFLKTVLYSR